MVGLNKLKALSILQKVEASTIKNKRVVRVNAAFNEFIEKDFEESEPEQVHYLPGHAVFKEDSTTNKRIMFNASATSETCNTLNECLFQGPCLLPDIVQVLIRFCLKMFLRIKSKSFHFKMLLHQVTLLLIFFTTSEAQVNVTSSFRQLGYLATGLSYSHIHRHFDFNDLVTAQRTVL
jgi:hypothetical protein